jgi:hypothetical protein
VAACPSWSPRFSREASPPVNPSSPYRSPNPNPGRMVPTAIRPCDPGMSGSSRGSPPHPHRHRRVTWPQGPRQGTRKEAPPYHGHTHECSHGQRDSLTSVGGPAGRKSGRTFVRGCVPIFRPAGRATWPHPTRNLSAEWQRPLIERLSRKCPSDPASLPKPAT